VAAAAAVVSLAPFALRAAFRSPAVGFGLMSAVLVAGVVLELPLVSVAGFRVDVGRDVVGLVLLGIGVLRLVSYRRRPANWIIAVFGGIFAVAILRGILTYGPGHLEFSGAFWILSGLAYGASFDLRGPRRRELLRVFQWAGLALVLLSGLVWAGAFGDVQIHSPPAFLLAQVGLVTLTASVESRHVARRSMAYAALFLGVATLLQHRTVWAASAVAVIYLVVLGGRRRSRLLVVIGAMAGLAVIAQLLGLAGSRTEFASTSLADSMVIAATDDRTYEWRQDYWRYTVETHHQRGPGAMLYGAGFGAPWMTFGPLVDRLEGPHNQYIEFYVRFGALGVGLWMALLAWVATRLWATRHHGTQVGLSNQALLVLVLMQVVWSITYWVDSWQPMLLGFALSAACNARSLRVVTTPADVETDPGSLAPSSATPGLM
jgi:O-antigen ligase